MGGKLSEVDRCNPIEKNPGREDSQQVAGK